MDVIYMVNDARRRLLIAFNLAEREEINPGLGIK